VIQSEEDQKETQIVTILLHICSTLNGNIINHSMIITNVEKLTGLRFCSKYCFGFRTSDHHTERFIKHCKEYDGKFHKKLKLNSSLALVPHIMKNKALQYMFAHKIELKKYSPVSSYITYDFETMNNSHVGNSSTKASKIDNTLHL
jgi:hypothetical protein